MSEGKKTDNFTMKAFLETIQNIVGPNGLKSILNYAHLKKYIDNFPPDNEELEIPLKDLQGLYYSLIELFGSKGARSLQLRVGRGNVQRGFDRRPKTMKAIQLAARLLPETKKIRLVLERLIEYDKKAYAQAEDLIELQEEGDYFLIIHRDRFESEGVISQTPVCGDFVGTIEALVEWITGHPHKVEEIECRAMGHPADVFKIAKVRKED